LTVFKKRSVYISIHVYRDPSGDDTSSYMQWKQNFKLSDKTDDISRILAEKESIRQLHSKLGTT